MTILRLDHRKILRVCIAGSLVVSVASCQTTKEDSKVLGAIVGGVAGTVIGSQFGSGKGQIFAALIGTAVGAFIGSKFAELLGEQDQTSLANSTQQSAVFGTRRAWRNPDTGVSGSTEVKNETKTRKNSQIKVLKDRVEETPPIEFVNAPYRVQKNSNVRGGPGTDYKVVDSVKAGKTVVVLGKVIDADWYLVSQGGVGSGYVYAPLLTEAVDVTPDDVEQDSGPVSPNDVVEVTVASGQTCRIVTQRVVLADGKEETDDVTVCNGPQGWQLV